MIRFDYVSKRQYLHIDSPVVLHSLQTIQKFSTRQFSANLTVCLRLSACKPGSSENTV